MKKQVHRVFIQNNGKWEMRLFGSYQQDLVRLLKNSIWYVMYLSIFPKHFLQFEDAFEFFKESEKESLITIGSIYK